MDVKVNLQGFEDLAAKLRALAPTMRKRVLRNALAAGARLVRDDAKRNAPVLSNAMKAPYRKPGTVRDAIRVRTSKTARRAGDVGVFVNVKPAKGGDRGAKSRNDPFYWRFLEFGRQGRKATTVVYRGKNDQRQRKSFRAAGPIAPMRFLRNAAQRLPEALRIFEKNLGTWFAKVNATGKVDP